MNSLSNCVNFQKALALGPYTVLEGGRVEVSQTDVQEVPVPTAA